MSIVVILPAVLSTLFHVYQWQTTEALPYPLNSDQNTHPYEEIYDTYFNPTKKVESAVQQTKTVPQLQNFGTRVSNIWKIRQDTGTSPTDITNPTNLNPNSLSSSHTGISPLSLLPSNTNTHTRPTKTPHGRLPVPSDPVPSFVVDSESSPCPACVHPCMVPNRDCKCISDMACVARWHAANPT